MASVIVVKPGKPDVLVETATQFVNLIYGQGYRPQYGTVQQAWATFYEDAPPGMGQPEWPVTPPPGDAGTLFRAATKEAVEEFPMVFPSGAWDFAEMPKVGGVPLSHSTSGGGGGGAPVPDPIDPDLYTFTGRSLIPDPTDPDLYTFA